MSTTLTVITYASPAAQTLFGLRPEDLVRTLGGGARSTSSTSRAITSADRDRRGDMLAALAA